MSPRHFSTVFNDLLVANWYKNPLKNIGPIPNILQSALHIQIYSIYVYIYYLVYIYIYTYTYIYIYMYICIVISAGIQNRRRHPVCCTTFTQCVVQHLGFKIYMHTYKYIIHTMSYIHAYKYTCIHTSWVFRISCVGLRVSWVIL